MIGDICSCIGELLEILGPDLLDKVKVNGASTDVPQCLVKIAAQIFAGQHQCQKLEEDEGIDEVWKKNKSMIL